jgi:hypothetical protein
MGTRWSIWIDIEGFSQIWTDGTRGQRGINALITGIYAIGSTCYPDPGQRLFVHQFGDGFLIISDFQEHQLDRCAAIAIVLMRYAAKHDCLARAAIAEGEFGDFRGCWPEHIRDAMAQSDRSNGVYMGLGLMTLIPVMGTALINANKLDSRNQMKGAILTIETRNLSRLSGGFIPMTNSKQCETSYLGWIHSDNPLIAEIASLGQLQLPSPEETERLVRRYFEEFPNIENCRKGTFATNRMML